jgi:hypothetical protein
MIVVATGGLSAALDAYEPLHGRAAAALAAATAPRLLSPFLLAELDYLVGTRLDHHAQLALADEVTRGVYRLEPSRPRTSGMRAGSWSAMPTCGSDSRMRQSS